MSEEELDELIEKELYGIILAMGDNDIQNVTVRDIKHAVQWFVLINEERITKPQIKLIVQKTWRMFENKNKNLTDTAKVKYDVEVYKQLGIETSKPENTNSTHAIDEDDSNIR